ncbi:MAG: SPFH domain-containing protein [Actinobacteria bacterium]|nr:MAG: SPFH domain-containing protein [Actinomycetota bacterium]
MGLFSREFIAVPDNAKGQLVFKWPDYNLRRYSRAIVDVDEMALFLNKGQVVGTIAPGQHQIDADELPFLGIFIDHATGDNAYRAELYFVGTREYPGQPFGGRVDDVKDPQTGMIVTLRVFGEYSIKVTDPVALITNLTGTVDVTSNDSITNWVGNQLLKVMRTEVTRQILGNGWPVLSLSAYTPDIEQTVINGGNEILKAYGLAVVRMGNFDVNLADQDEATLKSLAKDTAYSRMAGGFQQYAAGEALLGAGEGMSKGGAAAGGAILASGFGVGQQAVGGVAQPPPPQAPSQPAVGAGPQQTQPPQESQQATIACPSCSVQNPPGAKFCSSCGARLTPEVVHCSNCQAELAPGAKFCTECGTAVPAPAPAAGPDAPKES